MSISEPTGRPLVIKGALLIYDRQTPGTTPSQQIDFQYNPETLQRTFAPRVATKEAGASGAAKESVLSVAGPPTETLTLTIDLIAADRLDDPSKRALVNDDGLHGALAALELLMYPATAQVSQVEQQADKGAVQVHPADTPLVVLSYGRSRAVPVQLTSLTITEELHDPELNPIQAKVALGMTVLTYMEFTRSSVGRDTFIAHQKRKEQLARRWAGR